jgi:hypothetical protein
VLIEHVLFCDRFRLFKLRGWLAAFYPAFTQPVMPLLVRMKSAHSLLIQATSSKRCCRPVRVHLPLPTHPRVGRAHFIQAWCTVRKVLKKLCSFDRPVHDLASFLINVVHLKHAVENIDWEEFISLTSIRRG